MAIVETIDPESRLLIKTHTQQTHTYRSEVTSGLWNKVLSAAFEPTRRFGLFSKMVFYCNANEKPEKATKQAEIGMRCYTII